VHKLTLVTKNEGKIASFRAAFDRFGHVELDVRDLPLIEPQAKTVQEVAESKARQALELVKGDVVVIDGGFCIDALRGFPGPYTKTILDEWLGVDGLIRQMQRENNRACRFVDCLAYARTRRKNSLVVTTVYFFFSNIVGSFATAKYGEKKPWHWSDLALAFYPSGVSTTVGEKSREKYEEWKFRRKERSCSQQFADWFAEHGEE